MIYLLHSNAIESVSIGRDTINSDHINSIGIYSNHLDDVNLLSLLSAIEKNGNIRKFSQWAILMNPIKFIEILTIICKNKSKPLLHALLRYCVTQMMQRAAGRRIEFHPCL
ncbi:hypothetical protein ASY01nite_16640 [Acetobacter syzygii]|nr:hypothetical protein Absy_021_005 [Acetobacter syzygii]GBR62530.1 hypothetical protein AA0483_0422 [Acetobacter syzygii NRIC 0483]GEL56598.1 hypothetical protein ASY01nite_16640 [Acetobacter syzygii]